MASCHRAHIWVTLQDTKHGVTVAGQNFSSRISWFWPDWRRLPEAGQSHSVHQSGRRRASKGTAGSRVPPECDDDVPGGGLAVSSLGSKANAWASCPDPESPRDQPGLGPGHQASWTPPPVAAAPRGTLSLGGSRSSRVEGT